MIRHPDRWRPALSCVAAALVVLALAGCTGTPDPVASPTPSTTSAPATPSPSASASVAPALDPEGTADDNLAFFRTVIDDVWATDARGQGRAYIDALVAAGFDKAAMQVTNDTSTVGNAAESLQFSVRWGDECLVGQVGPATGEPFATVAPLIPGDVCLIGRTRPIDW